MTAKKTKIALTKKQSIGFRHPTRVISKPEPLTRNTVKSNLSPNTWVVFRAMSERKPMLFDGGLSRDKVRSAYSRIMKTKHDATRSKRLKNY